MKKAMIAVSLAALVTTCFIVRSHAQTAASRDLYFYGARLPSATVQVIAYTREGDKVEIKGNVTMTSEQWVAFSDAVVQAGFPASQGEPTPITSGGPRPR